MAGWVPAFSSTAILILQLACALSFELRGSNTRCLLSSPQGRAELSDILLLFIYLEIGATVGIYFKTTRLPVRYLIYIAMTALGRVLIEVGGAKTGKDLLIVAGAIL